MWTYTSVARAPIGELRESTTEMSAQCNKLAHIHDSCPMSKHDESWLRYAERWFPHGVLEDLNFRIIFGRRKQMVIDIPREQAFSAGPVREDICGLEKVATECKHWRRGACQNEVTQARGNCCLSAWNAWTGLTQVYHHWRDFDERSRLT